MRFLREGRLQSLLIVAGATVGVAVMVFLSALIGGLQQNLIRQTLGSQAHIVIRAPEETARPLREETGVALTRRLEQPAQRLRTLSGWSRLAEQALNTPGVTAAAPTITGAGLAARASATRSIVLRGIEPESFDQVVPLRERLTAGTLRLSDSQAAIGIELARELGAFVGDRIRLVGVSGEPEPFTVSAVFDLKNKDVNGRWVLVSLRSAQRLLDLAGDVTAVELSVARVFEAEELAVGLGARTGLVAESWMKTNQQLLVALRSQSSSSAMIQFFVVVAVALGIASVLVVSVVQKSREIGILKAMGARTRAVTRVFLIQGLVVGLTGALLGNGLGAGLAALFATLARNADGSPLFPVDLGPDLFLRATLVATVTGVVAAVAPARRAARLDPAVVSRNG